MQRRTEQTTQWRTALLVIRLHSPTFNAAVMHRQQKAFLYIRPERLRKLQLAVRSNVPCLIQYYSFGVQTWVIVLLQMRCISSARSRVPLSRPAFWIYWLATKSIGLTAHASLAANEGDKAVLLHEANTLAGS